MTLALSFSPPALVPFAGTHAIAVPEGPPIDFEIVHQIPGRVRLRVPRLRSEHELAARIEAFVARQPGVHSVRVAAACESVIVGYDPQDVTVIRIGAWLQEAPLHTAAPRGDRGAPEGRRELVLGVAGVALAVAGAPPIAIGALIVISGAPIVTRAIECITRERRLSVDALDATAVAVLAMRGNLFAAALSSCLIAAGEHIRSLTARRSHAALSGLLASADSLAWLVRGDHRERVLADSLQPDDVVVVYPGELVPIDGIVLDGHAFLDQKTLTGESMPVEKGPGAEVYAATLLMEGKLYVRTLRVANQTRAQRIIALLQSAPAHETAIGNYARRTADRLVLPTLGLAALVFGLTRDIARTVSILIFDFATGVRVSAPTTILASMTAAAHRDIVIKSGAAIENLAKVDVVIFDKTGTLTQGTPRVTAVYSLDAGRTSDEVLALAAAAEERVSHPVAQAIVAAALDRGIDIPSRRSSRYSVGAGVRARIGGQLVRVGDRRYMELKSMSVPDAGEDLVQQAAAQGVSSVLVSIEERVIGVICYADVARPESRDVVARLRAAGVRHVCMVTGDDVIVARAIAADLGIDEVRANTFPDEKVQIVREWQARGHVVAVVGDGINDSPALAYADVSFSIESGSEAARETADIVLHGGLGGVPDAIELARDALHLIRQNIGIVAVPNLFGMALATGGLIGPLFSTALNNGSTVVAGVNSLRPLHANFARRGRIVDIDRGDYRETASVAVTDAAGATITEGLAAVGAERTAI